MDIFIFGNSILLALRSNLALKKLRLFSWAVAAGTKGCMRDVTITEWALADAMCISAAAV